MTYFSIIHKLYSKWENQNSHALVDINFFLLFFFPYLCNYEIARPFLQASRWLTEAMHVWSRPKILYQKSGWGVNLSIWSRALRWTERRIAWLCPFSKLHCWHLFFFFFLGWNWIRGTHFHVSCTSVHPHLKLVTEKDLGHPMPSFWFKVCFFYVPFSFLFVSFLFFNWPYLSNGVNSVPLWGGNQFNEESLKLSLSQIRNGICGFAFFSDCCHQLRSQSE